MRNDLAFADVLLAMSQSLFQRAIERFDQENSRDPNFEVVDGTKQPRELVYAKRLSDWVSVLAPDASEVLKLAARCQHICRWTIPRDSYEMNRPGYLKWRSDLKKFHAKRAGEILREIGYAEEIVTKVQDLNLKSNFPNDPETQILEDALCLVFLQYQFAELASRSDDEKMINAVRKSWKKMSEAGRAAALKLTYTPKETVLLQAALKETV
ncbi:MAG: hypothetical protein JWM68_793 [Verrucomicrobiales bacterium]|nr:hypothetical protein [Verrucomicrobiales bacterium]